MKKFILTLILAIATLSVSAMSYERASEEARFITDKMAYELNLNDQQYNDCYEINLDYLLNLSSESDIIYGEYLAYRNADLRHILFDWQWSLFAAADYFLNPVSWLRGAWYFPIYRYYRVGYFYYDHPRVFWSYRGGHGRYYFHNGFYASRRPHRWAGGFRGMNRGAITHRGRGGISDQGHRNYRIGNGRASGSRSGNYNPTRDRRQGYTIGGSRSNGSISSSRSDNYSSSRSNGSFSSSRSNGSISSSRSGNYSSSRSNGSYSSSRSNGSFSGSRSNGSYSSSRSNGSYSSSRSNGSYSSSRSNGNYSGRSSYQRESSTRTTVRSSSYGSGRSSSSYGSGLSSSSRGSYSGSTRSSGSFSSSTRSSGSASHGGFSSSSRGGGSSRGGSSHGGGRGGR